MNINPYTEENVYKQNLNCDFEIKAQESFAISFKLTKRGETV